MRENLTPSQIEKIVSAAKRGDEKSFEKIFEFFYDKILRYTAFRVEERETEDIVSEVFLKVVEKLHSYVPDKKAGFNAWIFRIAHNTIIDFYRRKKEILGLGGGEDEEGENFFLQIEDESPRPDENTDHQFNTRRLYRILQKMPASMREILELKYLEGFSNAEVSHITGKSEGNIRVLQLRALREIRKMWGDSL